MKTLFLIILLQAGWLSLCAQSTFNGMSKKLGFEKMITPYGIEVTFYKTTHIIFPSAIRYVDLSSSDLIAGKADAAENVLRIKAATENFTNEANFSVICEDGSFYPFNVRYAKEPEMLSIEIENFLRDGDHSSQSDKSVQLKELGGESSALVDLIQKTIYQNNERKVRHLGCSLFGIQSRIKGIYIHDGILYLHLQIINQTNIPYTIDFIRFKVADKKLAKRTAMQEKIIVPLKVLNEETEVPGKSNIRIIYALPKFTLPIDKNLTIQIYERDGGRHQEIKLQSEDIELARTVSKLKTN